MRRDRNKSDTRDGSSTFSGRNLVAQSSLDAEGLRRSRFISSTHSYDDTTELEINNEYSYTEVGRRYSSPAVATGDGATYNALDFKNLKLSIDDTTYSCSRPNGEEYDTIHRNRIDRDPSGYDHYDHLRSNMNAGDSVKYDHLESNKSLNGS